MDTNELDFQWSGESQYVLLGELLRIIKKEQLCFFCFGEKKRRENVLIAASSMWHG